MQHGWRKTATPVDASRLSFGSVSIPPSPEKIVGKQCEKEQENARRHAVFMRGGREETEFLKGEEAGHGIGDEPAHYSAASFLPASAGTSSMSALPKASFTSISRTPCAAASACSASIVFEAERTLLLSFRSTKIEPVRVNLSTCLRTFAIFNFLLLLIVPGRFIAFGRSGL